MARYILDTNIILGYLRKATYAEVVERDYAPFTSPNIAAMSIVSRGELISLGYRNKWGDTRRTKLEELLRRIPQVDINNDTVMQMYGEIDAFSQGHHPTKKLTMTPRNMGKNDLWIAATTAATNTVLLTADSDFDHLDKVFFSVIKIDPQIKK